MHLSFFTLALMALTATAIPTDLVAAPAPADIEVDSVSALAKCDDNRTPWQGGGCQWAWSDCKQRCLSGAGKHKCCANTVGHYTDNANCVWGFETCECYCKKKL